MNQTSTVTRSVRHRVAVATVLRIVIAGQGVAAVDVRAEAAVVDAGVVQVAAVAAAVVDTAAVTAVHGIKVEF